MNENVTRYPLAWPTGWKRTAPHTRQHSRFAKRLSPRSCDSLARRTRTLAALPSQMARLTEAREHARVELTAGAS